VLPDIQSKEASRMELEHKADKLVKGLKSKFSDPKFSTLSWRTMKHKTKETNSRASLPSPLHRTAET
jgi:hypothetical protein